MEVLLFLLVAFFLVFGGLLVGVVRTQLLIRNLGASRRSIYEQAKAQLLSQGRSAIRLLIRGLQHKNPAVRRGSAEVLGAIKDPRALAPLLRAIDDHDKIVRWQAISALGALQEPLAIDRLSSLIRDPDKESRRRSVEALGKIGGIQVKDVLLDTLHDNDTGVRKHAIVALASLRSVEPLVPMLEDPNADVRLLAADTLKKYLWSPQTEREQIAYDIATQNWKSPLLSTPAAVEPLLLMLQDARPENMHARVNAVMALGKIGEPRAFEPLMQMYRHGDANIRETVISALGDLGDMRAIDVLIRALKDTGANVRTAAATAIGKFDNPRSIEALIQALGDTDPARLGDRNPEVQRAAATALTHMPGERVTAALGYALEDDDAIVRYEAAEVLIQRGWTPQDDVDRIRYHIAKENWKTLMSFGAQALPQLIVRSTDKERAIRDQVNALLNTLLGTVKIVLFGDLNIKPAHQRITLKNPNVDNLTIPMEVLLHIVIHIPTHEFHRIERFLTYAVNHIGQDHLKKHVEVHVYGDPTHLHTNLRNTLKNLCKEIKEHEPG